MKIPKEKKTKYIQIRVSEELYTAWRDALEKNHVNGSSLITSWVERWVRERQKEL